MWVFKCLIDIWRWTFLMCITGEGGTHNSVDSCIRWHINIEFAASDFCCLWWKTHIVSAQWQMLMLLVFWSYLRNFINPWLYVKLSCLLMNVTRLTDKLFVCSTLRPQTHMIPINVKGDSIIVDLKSVVERWICPLRAPSERKRKTAHFEVNKKKRKERQIWVQLVRLCIEKLEESEERWG